MSKLLNTIVLSGLLASPALFAEEDLNKKDIDRDISGRAAESQPEQVLTPQASTVLPESAPAAANTLVTQTGNTVMTAGTCVVIDGFLRQYCSENPGDASCQF